MGEFYPRDKTIRLGIQLSFVHHPHLLFGLHEVLLNLTNLLFSKKDYLGTREYTIIFCPLMEGKNILPPPPPQKISSQAGYCLGPSVCVDIVTPSILFLCLYLQVILGIYCFMFQRFCYLFLFWLCPQAISQLFSKISVCLSFI